jgi:hypothetical protein
MLKLLNTPQLLVEKPYGRHWLVLRRTPTEWGSLDEVARAYQQAVTVLRRADFTKLGLLVDLRKAPPGQDRQFDRAMADHESQLPGFRRVALLVGPSMAGLPALRHVKSFAAQAEIFTREEDAVKYLDVL